MATDTKNQAIQGIRSVAFALLLIQFEKLIDIVSCVQLLLFTIYAHFYLFKEEFIFYFKFKIITNIIDFLKKLIILGNIKSLIE